MRRPMPPTGSRPRDQARPGREKNAINRPELARSHCGRTLVSRRPPPASSVRLTRRFSESLAGEGRWEVRVTTTTGPDCSRPDPQEERCPSTRCPTCPTTTRRSSRTTPPRSSSSTTTSTTPTYVKGANTALEKLAAARENEEFGTINQLQKNLAFNLSGHVLHSLFWKNMSPDGGDKPDGELAAAIDESFGTFEGFRSQLSEASLNVQGSGWGALTWEPVGAAAHRRAGLRPPEQRRARRAAAARARHVGARVLPAVQEREGRLGRRVLEHRELGRRHRPVRQRTEPQAAVDRSTARPRCTGGMTATSSPSRSGVASPSVGLVAVDPHPRGLEHRRGTRRRSRPAPPPAARRRWRRRTVLRRARPPRAPGRTAAAGRVSS